MNFTSSATFHTIRLKPGQDLKRSILDWANSLHLTAGCVVTCVGSLTQAKVRLASGKGATEFPGPFEIVSLVGTFSSSSGHFHISLSDTNGHLIGGHLLEGNTIFTTAEIVVAELPEVQFQRELDPDTGYLELKIKK